MTLTRRGWALAAGGLALTAAGRLLGLLELYVLGAGCWALVVTALVFVAARPAHVDVRRTLTPGRVRAGDEARVELAVTNRARQRSPVIDLLDPVGGGPRRARLLLAPFPAGSTERAHYRIPTERRGVLAVGPLEIRRFDPLAIATRGRVVGPESELVVYPPTEELLPLPHAPGDDRRGGARRATAVGGAGEDFYALRPWVVGDDIRRVHWPSTARRDELMVRQHDVPWQGRTTVVLDVRAAHHDDGSLEQAVSAAASILTSSGRDGSLVRLLTTDGADTGFGTGTSHEALLERLARVEAVTLAGAGAPPRLPETSGAVALVVTASVPAGELALLARLGAAPGSLTVVVVGRKGAPASRATPGRTVAVGPGRPLAPAWNRAVSRPTALPSARGGAG